MTINCISLWTGAPPLKSDLMRPVHRNARRQERVSKRGVSNIVFRSLGVLLGAVIVFMAPTTLIENGRHTPWDTLSCLGMLCVGVPFLLFGITGNPKPQLVPRKAAWWVAVLGGLLFLVAGVYALAIEEQRSVFRTSLALSWLPIGAGLIWLGFLIRRFRPKGSVS